MSALRVTDFADVRDDVAGILGDIVYSTMTTVDRHGRPRSRVLIIVWELDSSQPVGWLATFKTPVKAAHLARNPHVTAAYWSARQDAIYLDSVAAWVDDSATRQHVWSLYQVGSPAGVGYDPGQFWKGAGDPEFHVLRLDPWRIQVLRSHELRADKPSRIWRRDEVTL